MSEGSGYSLFASTARREREFIDLPFAKVSTAPHIIPAYQPLFSYVSVIDRRGRERGRGTGEREREKN